MKLHNLYSHGTAAAFALLCHYPHNNLAFPTIPTTNTNHNIKLQRKRLQQSKDGEVSFAPSRFVMDDDTDEKWRLCAGAAVLNSQNKLLVGKKGSYWQCPQGGVDIDESINDAASRELYEETGLVTNQHVAPIVIDDYDDDLPPLRYRTKGTKNWMEDAGFVGQELHWRFFRLMDARGDQDPSLLCDLSGCGGEPAEFSQVQWRSVNDTVEQMVDKKAETYEALRSTVLRNNMFDHWKNQLSALDFTGTWRRDSSLSVNVTAALALSRGLLPNEAQFEADKPCIQNWKRTEPNSTWIVTTYQVDDGRITPQRILEYPIVSEQQYSGKAVLFSSSSGRTLQQRRTTTFVAEPKGHHIPIALVTLTEKLNSDGSTIEKESRRYLKDNGTTMVLRRTFAVLSTNSSLSRKQQQLLTSGNIVTCSEVFMRDDDEDDT